MSVHHSFPKRCTDTGFPLRLKPPALSALATRERKIRERKIRCQFTILSRKDERDTGFPLLVQEQEPEDVEVHWRARLEPVASSASGHERMINSWAAASGENGLDFPQESSIR